jgi:hypothetical protein
MILHRVKICAAAIAAVAWLSCSLANAVPPPTSEFDIPYQLRVDPNGETLELSGSFSWALPQNFQAVLASAPRVRLVRLESPGGHVLPALQVAMIIQQHGLDTYVGRLCASACTIAFLGGRERWLAAGARLGFHQARARGFPAEQVNEYLRQAYVHFHVPQSFIAHVLRTRPADIWFPTPAELRAVRYTTGDAPASALAVDHGWPPRLTDLARQLWTAPDEAVLAFGTALSDLLVSLQTANPEACWAFAHEGPDAPQVALSPASVRGKGMILALQGLRPGADHALFCPSLHELLLAIPALPEALRAGAFRAVLSPGGSQM